jgi:hypothetical protein
MPRTRSTREHIETTTQTERLQRLRSKIDLFIFFQYYDGHVTKGLVGFDPTHPAGSMKHKKPVNILNHLTTSKFRGKGQKLSKLAKEFINHGVLPPPDLRPQFDSAASIEELLLEIQGATEKDTRTPEEKLTEVTKAIERSMFFNYYDGISTDGRIGFNPRSGPPGSVNHKRAYAIFDPVTPSDFRLKGKAMAGLAKDFVDKNVVPSEDLRPHFVRATSSGLLQGATAAGYY